jgi:hypothetical protein
VDVTFDAPSFGIGCRDHASARGTQLARLPTQLVERRLQGRVEPEVAERKADATAQLREDALLVLVERLAADLALGDHEAEQLPSVHDGRDAQLGLLAAGHQHGQPDRRPGRP